MNNKELELWKEKTKGLFHITQYNKFWKYIDTLIKQNKNIKTAIEYIEKNTIDTTFYIDFDGEINYVLNLLKGDNK